MYDSSTTSIQIESSILQVMGTPSLNLSGNFQHSLDIVSFDPELTEQSYNKL